MINDILGYIATALTILSMTFNDQIRLRIVNGIAAVLWIMYGLLIDSNPNIIVNAVILGIHINWLYKKNNLKK